METEYISVRFTNNDSRRWDGKLSDVPSKTVVRTGRYNEEGMEEAEVHWPVKGKGKGDVKIWHCVVLPESAARTEQEDIMTKRPRAEPEHEDIGPKPAKKARDEHKQEDIGPKPAKRRHTTGKDYVTCKITKFMCNSRVVHVFIRLCWLFVLSHRNSCYK